MRAIGIILAGSSNKRMKNLTMNRDVAAMPMAGTYRAIDWVLTNMSDSNVQKVAVLAQYNTRTLQEHLSSSKWWDFGRKQGGLFIYTPTLTPENSNWFRGNIDSIYQNMHFLKDSHEPYVIIASADAIYQLDYSKVLDYHVQKRADITMVTTTLQPWEDSLRYGQIITDEDGRVTTIEEQPMEEVTREVNCGIYIIRRRLLIELLETCMSEDRYDFESDILVRYRKVKRIYSYHLDSYWSNIGSVNAYFHTNMDFLREDVRKLFFTGDHSVLTKVNDFPPAKYNPGSNVHNSLIASGSIINGTVEDSLIFKRAFIGSNCYIKNCVILNDVYIGDNCRIENCIVESHNTIYPNSQHIGDPNDIRVVQESGTRYGNYGIR